METIALTLAPSSPNPPGGQTSKSRTGDDNTFAPALSDAVAKKQTRDESRPEKPSRKAQPVEPENATEEKITASTGDTPSASQTKKTTENPPESALEDNGTTSQPEKSRPHETPPFLLGIGVSGDLIPLSEAAPVTDLRIAIEPQSGTLSIGKQDSFDIAGVTKDTSAGSQIEAVPSQTTHVAPPQQTLQNAALEGQMNLVGRGADKSMLPAATGQDQSVAAPSTKIAANTAESVNNAGQDTLLAQLQKILATNGADKAIFVQQPASRSQAADMESLFPPLYTLTDTSDQKTTLAAPSNDGLAASLSGITLDKLITGDKNTERISSSSKEDLHLFLSQAGAQGDKDNVKIQEKEATLQDASKQQQSTLLNSTPSTDATGSSSQAGQFSFGTTLLQNMQAGHHPAGTTGSTYMLPWTLSQEHNLINQVTQHFQIHSGSSTSKLSLKLYPEELGELKIDIQMKDGSIKANIVTQNEQVQQVLEKYIPKLRSFMEQQGITVDDILVTNTSSDVGKHDLFQEDFVNNHNNFSSPERSGRSTSFIDHSFETDLVEKSSIVSGVNVTV